MGGTLVWHSPFTELRTFHGTCLSLNFEPAKPGFSPFSELRTCRTKVLPCPFSELRTLTGLELKGTGLSHNIEPAKHGLYPILSPNYEPAEPGLARSNSELQTETLNYRQKHIPGPSCYGKATMLVTFCFFIHWF